mmetsp:Transcript_4902/g.7149  ORF Transcript_4902/g.7149 Transcript_4902/m.7149 type:complete len:264 (-) Transcript_4902:9-800(-)
MLVPSNSTPMLAVQAPSSHSRSTLPDPKVAVKVESSPTARSHATLISPSLVMVGETLFSSSSCWDTVTLCESALATSSTSVSPEAHPTVTLASPLATSYSGLMVRSSNFFVAPTVLTENPSPVEARMFTLKSPFSALISRSADPKSLVSMSARAVQAQPELVPPTCPHTDLGREAMSLVGRTDASNPNSKSRSPLEEEEDQLRVGSSPSSPLAAPSAMFTERDGRPAEAAPRMERRATAEYFMMMMINVFSYEEEKKKTGDGT